jgi:hypothetical protein
LTRQHVSRSLTEAFFGLTTIPAQSKGESIMRVLQPISLVLAMSFATVAAAQTFDGTVPLVCTVTQAHDCLPTATSCNRLKPESDIAPVFGIDFAKKEVRSPYRTALLKVVNTTTNEKSLVLQGADLLMAWSATVNKATGALTVSVADAKGAYVAFGQCK